MSHAPLCVNRIERVHCHVVFWHAYVLEYPGTQDRDNLGFRPYNENLHKGGAGELHVVPAAGGYYIARHSSQKGGGGARGAGKKKVKELRLLTHADQVCIQYCMCILYAHPASGTLADVIHPQHIPHPTRLVPWTCLFPPSLPRCFSPPPPLPHPSLARARALSPRTPFRSLALALAIPLSCVHAISILNSFSFSSRLCSLHFHKVAR